MVVAAIDSNRRVTGIQAVGFQGGEAANRSAGLGDGTVPDVLQEDLATPEDGVATEQVGATRAMQEVGKVSLRVAGRGNHLDFQRANGNAIAVAKCSRHGTRPENIAGGIPARTLRAVKGNGLFIAVANPSSRLLGRPDLTAEGIVQATGAARMIGMSVGQEQSGDAVTRDASLKPSDER